MLAKKITFDMNVSAPTNGAYCIIKSEMKVQDGSIFTKYLKSTDMTWTNDTTGFPTGFTHTLTEDTNEAGLFVFSKGYNSSHNKWDGEITAKAYIQSGGSPVPASDLTNSKTIVLKYYNDIPLEDYDTYKAIAFTSGAMPCPDFDKESIKKLWHTQVGFKSSSANTSTYFYAEGCQ